MKLLLRCASLTLCLSLVLAHEVAAQNGTRRERKKPFAEFSESARRLRDSVFLRRSGDVGAEAPVPLAEPIVRVPGPFEVMLLRDSLISVARSQLGTRYRLGAEVPGKAFDCSGLIRYVMAALRLDLPRTAHEQAKLGREVARDTAQLRPGDLLTFGTRRRITHIGIYAGEGRVIHASTSRRQVIETSLASLGPSLLRSWQSARRLIVESESIAEAQ
jgi:NlpC/P60 family